MARIPKNFTTTVTPTSLVAWIEEKDIHLDEIADIVARRAIGWMATGNKTDAKKWLKSRFMLPKLVKYIDLFDPLNQPGQREDCTKQIVKAVRDRLKADQKRWDENGYRTKWFLETLERDQ